MQYCFENAPAQTVRGWLFIMIFMVFALSDPRPSAITWGLWFFIPLVEFLLLTKRCCLYFVRQFTVKVKFSWTVSSDLCCWLWHLARNTSSDEHDVLIFVPSSLVLILSRLSNASVIDAPINELSNRTQPWPCVRAWQCHHLSSRLRRNSFSNVLARLRSMMRP